MDPIETLVIDELPPEDAITNSHQIPAMFGGQSVLVSVLQVSNQVELNLADELAAKAPLASPAFTGNPTAPTQAGGNSSTRLATTAFVQGELAADPLTAKTTPVDADLIRIADSAASFVGKKLTFANLWAWISAKVLTLFNASGSAPVYACRAWVRFIGTGTVTIVSSGNVLTVTDNAVGVYTPNFITSMPNANYAYSLSISGSAATSQTLGQLSSSPPTTGGISVFSSTVGSGAADVSNYCVEIFC